MAYVTDQQLIHHIRNGKSLGWLIEATGKSDTELEDIALQAGYVFGSNGVARRSSIPEDVGQHQLRADDSPEGAERSQEPAPVDEHAAELVVRDVLDDQADLELDRRLDAIEELDWPTLVDLGDASPVESTNELAGEIRTEIDLLRTTLIGERDAEHHQRQLMEHVLAAEQLEVQLRALNARIDELTPDSAIRRWAKSHGMSCPARGAVPRDLRRAYVGELLRDAS